MCTLYVYRLSLTEFKVEAGLIGASEQRTIKHAIELNHYSYLNYLLFVKDIVAAWEGKLLFEVVEV